MAREQTQTRRDRRWAWTLTAAAVACCALLGWRVAFAAPVPDLPSRTLAAGPGGSPSRLVFGGDTMLGDGAGDFIKQHGADALLTKIKPLLDGEVVIVNAEGPVTDSKTLVNVGAQYAYAATPGDSAALARAGVDVLALANNHAMDFGGQGLTDTISFATALGMNTVGGGADRAQAEKPLLLHTPDLTVGVIAMGENFGPLSRSGPAQPGMVPFSPDRIMRAVTLARTGGADRVIAFVHWGDNYSEVNESQRYWAQQLVDAGVDVIIGSGSHTLQGAELVDGVPVLYGIGNLVFGTNGRFEQLSAVGLGAVATVQLSRTGGTVGVRCIVTDNQVTGYVPTPCTASELASARSILGPAVSWKGDAGTLTFDVTSR